MSQKKDSSQKEITPIQILVIFDAAKITSHKTVSYTHLTLPTN